MGGQPPDRLGRLEVLGAWLGLWTPPRDAVVPPVPWKRIVIGAVVLLVVVGAAAAVFLPGVADDRQAAREREQRAAAARHAATLASADREQRPRRGRGQADPGDRAAAERRTAARRALLASAESRIGVDAHARTGTAHPRRRLRAVPAQARRRRSGRGSVAPGRGVQLRRRHRPLRERRVRDRQGHHRDAVPAGRAFHSRELHLVPDRPARRSRPARSSTAARVPAWFKLREPPGDLPVAADREDDRRTDRPKDDT